MDVTLINSVTGGQVEADGGCDGDGRLAIMSTLYIYHSFMNSRPLQSAAVSVVVLLLQANGLEGRRRMVLRCYLLFLAGEVDDVNEKGKKKSSGEKGKLVMSSV